MAKKAISLLIDQKRKKATTITTTAEVIESLMGPAVTVVRVTI